MVTVMENAFIEQSFTQTVPRWPFAIMRMFLGAMWLYEAFRNAPWDLPALVVGLFLLAGILTPISSLAGIVLTLFIYNHRAGLYAWGEWPWLYWLIILLHAVMIVTRAGRRYGADAIAARDYPEWPVW